jgi:tetratricopeptide (TPR) repeat protein
MPVMGRPNFVAIFLFALAMLLPAAGHAQATPPPTTPAASRRAAPPDTTATSQTLEARGDELRVSKDYLSAADYYQAALAKTPKNVPLINKLGMCQLLMQRFPEARKSFERAIKVDRTHSDAYSNLGVVFYETRNYGRAIHEYEKAVSLNPNVASYYNNLGVAQFARKEYQKAAVSYSKALALDPDIFERTSRAGVQAQIASPEDRAQYDYVLAKLYAQQGVPDRSLHYLKKAIEDGYKKINDVYKDREFAELRKDPRFAELMAAKTNVIPD